ncbi:hypothetical protein POJ06DRAFT_65840 [Lipomyces tetrasporus]|uniref:Hyaluronan/mRNA-binding protein domain-containing protein n=1 Tax=Lipomyces tetrasporus TaxID=54092 RepID=A0AAD7VWA9_9ASCO|nr:uncharacterized protein POJ06DRAFT_65840 [Lipomyces tetrasporus]KAJ8103240.1 hypothetical protein POJ06DRAFT_65840 [Lipomyces tetrasporus]
MSVASTNKFSLLADDIEDPDIAPSPPVAPPKEIVKQSTSSKKTDQPPKAARPENARPNRGPRNANEEAARDKNAGRSANRSRPTDSDAPRGGRGGRGRGRGGSRRQFDRHSGALPDSEKQVAEAWGSPATEWKDEQASKVDASQEFAEVKAEDVADTGATTNGAPEPVAEDPVPAPEEEDHSKTLEEYLEELNVKSAELGPKLPLRKPNEGEDQSTWGTVVSKEVDEDDSPYIAGLKPKSKEAKAKVKKEKIVVEIEPRFADPAGSRRGRGGPRGGRGGERGGRGGERGDRGGERGGRGGRGRGRGGRGASSAPVASSAPAVNLTNLSDFPSLS